MGIITTPVAKACNVIAFQHVAMLQHYCVSKVCHIGVYGLTQYNVLTSDSEQQKSKQSSRQDAICSDMATVPKAEVDPYPYL
eukprot:scaffold11440_cov246-Chaetoceros_neogracile.AAC.2